MKTLRVAVTVLASLMSLSALAQDAQSRKWVNLRAGPQRDYPLVAQLPPGSPLEVAGCTEGFGWCDVIGPGGVRGWVYAGNLWYPYQSAEVPILGYGAMIGLPILSFSIGNYWGEHYRDRPWYGEESRWRGHPPPRRPQGPGNQQVPGNQQGYRDEPGGPPRSGFAQPMRPSEGRPPPNPGGHPGGAQGGGHPQGGGPQGSARPQGGGGPPAVVNLPGRGGPPTGARPQGGGGPPPVINLQGGGGPPAGARPQRGGDPAGGARPQGGGGPPGGARPQGGGGPAGGARPQGGGGPPGGGHPEGGGGRPEGGGGHPGGGRPQEGGRAAG